MRRIETFRHLNESAMVISILNKKVVFNLKHNDIWAFPYYNHSETLG